MTQATLGAPLRSAKILLTCGTGGVGKTTTAAVLGLAAAQLGRRVLVLTIDPARRLAQALGLPAAPTDAPQRIWSAAKKSEGGACDMLMLDAKRTFDRVIERYAPDAATAQSILNSPLYQQLSSAITGSQEYMAMEQLYEIVAADQYDLVILDTPPSSHAIDFFRAPARLIHALSDSMLKLFVGPTLRAGRFGAQLLQKGANTVLKLFGRVTGADMLQEVSQLLLSSVGLFGGFGDRAKAVQQMLRDRNTGIVLVTVPHNDLIADAIAFARAAKREKMRVVGTVINRIAPDMGEPNAAHAAPPPALAAHLHHLWAATLATRAQQTGRVEQLRKALGARVPITFVDDSAEALHSIEALLRIAEHFQ